VASVGLDRFVRVHDIDSRDLLHKVCFVPLEYCLLFCSELGLGGGRVRSDKISSRKPRFL